MAVMKRDLNNWCLFQEGLILSKVWGRPEEITSSTFPVEFEIIDTIVSAGPYKCQVLERIIHHHSSSKRRITPIVLLMWLQKQELLLEKLRKWKKLIEMKGLRVNAGKSCGVKRAWVRSRILENIHVLVFAGMELVTNQSCAWSVSGSQLQQFLGSGISRNDPGSGKWFPGSYFRSKKNYVEKRKKYILSSIEIYKNRLKVCNNYQTTYKIAVNHLSHSYAWKLVSNNMWYVR